MNAKDNEDERRRLIAQLQEVVRRPHHVASESGKDPEAAFALHAKRADAPARPADFASRQGDWRKAVAVGRVPRPTPPLQGQDLEIKRSGPPGRGWGMSSADILPEGAEMAPSPAAARSDAVRDSRNYGGELRDFLRKHKEEFATLVAASADVRSRRYLLGAAAITVILGLAGLAASFALQAIAPQDRAAPLSACHLLLAIKNGSWLRRVTSRSQVGRNNTFENERCSHRENSPPSAEAWETLLGQQGLHARLLPSQARA